ncbi:hypothetical protein [Rubritalea sp.]|uniref:hypothetical protein n=1 Tax=Rubritalea sp. TaxID=2109375 RepID=UPI003242CCDE
MNSLWVLRQSPIVLTQNATCQHYCEVAETLIHKTSTALAIADKASLRNRVNSLLSKEKSLGPLIVGLLLAATVSSTFALAVIRPQSSPLDNPVNGPSYSADEVELRMSASPFPGDL